jgi:preprotein translocase subunit SecA
MGSRDGVTLARFSFPVRIGPAARVLGRCRAAVGAVNALESDRRAWSDAELRAVTGRLRERLAGGADLDSLLPEAFAAVREAASRTIGQRPVDEQIMGAVALHLGTLVEMKTGEGKTLTSTLPAYLNALSGRGVHVMTANDYLVARDAEWMGPVYRALGLECGVVLASGKVEPAARRAAYAADITYGTASEMAYDYLRDNMVRAIGDVVQRGHRLAIVDEADLILIDQARTEPRLTQTITPSGLSYSAAAIIAWRLERDRHYAVDAHRKMVSLTDEGIARVEDLLGTPDLFGSADPAAMRRLDCALRAKEVYQRDQDYIVVDGVVEIVDRLTGRVNADSAFGDGLPQAIEVKEGLVVRPEHQELVTITTREYLRQYERLAGLTGVATEAEAYRRAYGLDTVAIPTHRPMRRVDRPARFYSNDRRRLDAVVDEVAVRRASGRPVLVGAGSIAQSEQVSRALCDRGIPHEVLNAKNHRDEAQIIARSGRIGAVTVVTRMAGRGVDIRLGGDDPTEHEAVLRHGGLYVLAVDVFETRRLESHLRGRAGRRGDPGESAMFLSLEDESLRFFVRAESLEKLADSFGDSAGSVQNKVIGRALERALDRRTAHLVDRLVDSVRYDDVLGRQRTEIYALRRSYLEGAALGVADLELERRVALSVIDRDWRQHLQVMGDVFDGVTLHSLTGSDPLAWFQREGAARFAALLQRISEEIVGCLLGLKAEAEAKAGAEAEAEAEAGAKAELAQDSKDAAS